MADYKFNGTELNNRNGSRVGKIDRNDILDAHGSRVGKIDRNDILDAHGSRIGKIDRDDILDAHGSRIGTMTDVRKSIEGPGGVTLVALWLIFVR